MIGPFKDISGPLSLLRGVETQKLEKFLEMSSHLSRCLGDKRVRGVAGGSLFLPLVHIIIQTFLHGARTFQTWLIQKLPL